MKQEMSYLIPTVIEQTHRGERGDRGDRGERRPQQDRPYQQNGAAPHEANGNQVEAPPDDGNDNIVYTQRIEYTDFPLDEIKLYFVNNVIHLPSEY